MRIIMIVALLSGFGALMLSAEHGVRHEALQLSLTDDELDWVGDRIFQNECAGKRSCLVHWNEGEAFPSLGIGHFIWYPLRVEERFVESFPSLLKFMKERSVPMPEWLAGSPPPPAPWPDRETFLDQADGPRAKELRAFLEATKAVQAEFIFQRARSSLANVTNAAPASQQPVIRRHLQALSRTPGGIYALMDYVNFKGEGLSSSEQYQGEGWGLLQVLMSMDDDNRPALEQFRTAAASVLTRRADNADADIERERWLPGWLRRLESYREPVPGSSASK
ncbi:MAG: hypothetical protein ABR522_03935 [Marinobacter sp.]